MTNTQSVILLVEVGVLAAVALFGAFPFRRGQ